MSMKLMEEVEALKKDKANAQARLVLNSGMGGMSEEEARKMGANPGQKLRVCDVCGALLSIHDSDQYVAWCRCGCGDGDVFGGGSFANRVVGCSDLLRG